MTNRKDCEDHAVSPLRSQQMSRQLPNGPVTNTRVPCRRCRASATFFSTMTELASIGANESGPAPTTASFPCFLVCSFSYGCALSRRSRRGTARMAAVVDNHSFRRDGCSISRCILERCFSSAAYHQPGDLCRETALVACSPCRRCSRTMRKAHPILVDRGHVLVDARSVFARALPSLLAVFVACGASAVETEEMRIWTSCLAGRNCHRCAGNHATHTCSQDPSLSPGWLCSVVKLQVRHRLGCLNAQYGDE